mmetsp:Transcript_27647/g.31571  ORF Transcript_27647/g.31571 Transcript_27647/m.31571 type:complete len:225 (-) Transcript_27647:277-951(-)
MSKDMIEVTVIAGQQMGLKISRTKPLKVLAISETSSFRELGVEAGMYVDSLILENGEKHTNMDLREFTTFLTDNIEYNYSVRFTKTVNSNEIKPDHVTPEISVAGLDTTEQSVPEAVEESGPKAAEEDVKVTFEEATKKYAYEEQDDLYWSEVDTDVTTVGKSEIDADDYSFDVDASLDNSDVSIDADKTILIDTKSIDADKTLYTCFTYDADVSLGSFREHWA